jgi:hypothetical protein
VTGQQYGGLLRLVDRAGELDLSLRLWLASAPYMYQIFSLALYRVY